MSKNSFIAVLLIISLFSSSLSICICCEAEKVYTLINKNRTEVETLKLPKQAKICAIMLIDNFSEREDGIILEDEIRVLIEKYKQDGILETKQPSERIFKYYRSELKMKGVINYG